MNILKINAQIHISKMNIKLINLIQIHLLRSLKVDGQINRIKHIYLNKILIVLIQNLHIC